MPVPKQILYLTEADVQKTLTIDEAVDLAEKGIKELFQIQQAALEVPRTK